MDFWRSNSKKVKQVIALSIVGLMLISTFMTVTKGFDVDDKDERFDEEIERQKRFSKTISSVDDVESNRALIRTIDDGEDVGEHTSIDNSSGYLYISFYSSSDNSLKLARNELSTPDEWYIWTLDDEGDVGKYSSIDVVDQDVHVAYYDSSNQNLKYLNWCEGGDSKTEVIDDEGDVGKYASLEVGNEKVHVSYYDASEGRLKYAFREEDQWEITSFDHAGDVGQYTSIALNGGDPHIAHYDWTDRDLMYTRNDGSGWEHDSVGGSDRHMGRHASLALDDDGNAHMACHEWTDDNYQLEYITNAGGDLDSETVDEETPFVGTHTSIAIDKGGTPVVSYHRWDEENLKLAWKEDGEWSVERVDADHRVGSHTSLVMKRKGEAHVSYYDKAEGNLKYARVFTRNRTPLAPQNFNTSSEYGEILLEWDEPLYDGIPEGDDNIWGYNLYRKNESDGEEEFEMIGEDLTRLSYRDDIPTENESDTYVYKVAAVNKKGEGDESTRLRTKAKYFDYEMIGQKTNNYTIEDLSPLEVEADGDTDNYELRWDYHYNESQEADWDKENTTLNDDYYVTKKYDEAGLKSVMLEIESESRTRRCLQSAWVLGYYNLTSTYEMEDSNEVFFHINDSFVPIGYEGTSELKNTYIFEGNKDLPYRAVNFTFNENVKRPRLGDKIEPNYTEEESAFWNETFTVSDAREDTEVVVEPVLYNEHRDSYEKPFGSDFDYRDDQKQKDVQMIEKMTWVNLLLSQTADLKVENVGDGDYYHGWELEFDVNFDDDAENESFLNFSSVMPSGINKLSNYFGGDYGFEVDTFPDEAIKFNNNGRTETTLLTFSTDAGEDRELSGEFGEKFGKSMEYSGDTETQLSVTIPIDMVVNPVEKKIGVEGSLELEFNAELKIDIPLQSIGIADVGLTAEVGGGIGVEFEIGGLYYEAGEGVTPEPPDKIPIEMMVNFGGGPYAEVAAGLARVEGKFICELTVGVEIPSGDKDLGLEGRFEVVAEAAWGLWEKSKSWELFSKDVYSNSAYPELLAETEGIKDFEIFSNDRLYTRDYYQNNEGLKPNLSPETSDGTTSLGENVAPDSNPQIEYLNDDSGLAVWGDINESGADPKLYNRTYENGEWSGPGQINNLPNTAYNPELIRWNDDKLMMLYQAVEEELTGDNAGEQFFQNNSIRAKTWSPSTGWSESLFNYSVDGEPITGYDVNASNEQLYITYRAGESKFDVFNASYAADGTIGLIRAEMGADGLEITDEWETEEQERMSTTSIPAVEYTGSDAWLSYTRNVEEDGEEVKSYNETVLVKVDSSSQSIDEMENCTVRETENSTSQVILSKENNKMVVSWVENHSTIRRREVEKQNNGWDKSEIETVFSGRTVSSLEFHENETGKFYTFQGGENAIPRVIQSKDEGWGYLRAVSKENAYSHGQLNSAFSVQDPKMIYVEEEEVIEDWHTAHYTFNHIEEDKVKDESEYGNKGDLEGNYSITRHSKNGTRDHGDYIQFRNGTGKMTVPSSSSLNVTEEREEFTVTSMIRLGEKDEGSFLKKGGSWAVKYVDDQGDKILVELWNGSEKVTKRLEPQNVELEEWFFLGVRYEQGNSDITHLNVTVMKKNESLTSERFRDHTETFILEDFGGLDSSSDPLTLAGDHENISIDDFRLVERYLPNASMMKIYSALYPDFDKKRDIRTQAVPPYVNFTVSGGTEAGDPIEFEGKSSAGDLNWTWTFDEEEKRYGKKVNYIFTDTGHHRVKLKAIHNRTGARAYHEKTIHVIDTTPPDFDGVEDHTIFENNSVELSWESGEDFSGPIKYRIHHVKGEEKFNQSFWVKSTYNNSAVLEELEPDVMHQVKVTAEDKLGNVNNDTRVEDILVEDNLPPEFDGVENVYTSDHHDKTINLEWNPASDHSEPITYRVYHSRGKNLSFEDPIKEVNNTTTSVFVSEIGLHYFAVRAKDDEGNIEKNEKIKYAKVKDTGSPTLDIIKPEAGTEVSSTVRVEWEAEDDHSGISKYYVWSDDNETPKIVETKARRANYTFGTLPDGERTLTVKAVDEAGNHVRDSVTVEVVGPHLSPEVELVSPEDTSKYVSTSPSLQVNVTHSKDVAMDVSFYQVGPDGDSLIGKEKDVHNGETAAVEWSGLEENTTYDWYVIVDDGEVKTRSDTWSFTTIESSPQIEINEFDITPICGEAPLNLSMTGKIENIGEKEGWIDLSIKDEENSEVIKSWTYSLGAGGSKTIEESYVLEEIGNYTVTLGEEEEGVTVKGELILETHSFDVPEEVTVGETRTIEATVENLKESEEDAYIFVGNEEVHRETIPVGENKSFKTDYTFDEVGEVDVEVRDGEGDALSTESVSVLGSSMIEVVDFEINRTTYGEIPLEVWITGEIENQGQEEGGICLSIKDENSEEINSWTYSLGAGESKSINESFEFEEVGNYTVTLGEKNRNVTVIDEGERKLKAHSLETPDEVIVGETETIKATVENLQDEQENTYIYVAGKEVHTETISGRKNRTFETEHTFEELGDVDVEVRDSEGDVHLEESVTVVDASKIEVTDLDVAPLKGEVPLTVSISGDVKNLGSEAGDVNLSIEDESEEIKSWTYSVEPDGSLGIEEHYEFAKVGEYEITLGERTREVTVVEEGEIGLKPHSLDVTEEIKIGETGTIEGTVENLHEGEENAYIYVGGEKVHEETIPGGQNRTFETEHTFEERGEVAVEVRDEEGDPLLKESVLVLESSQIDVNALDIKPIYGEVPLRVSITGEIENRGDKEGEIDLSIEDNTSEELDSWTYSLGPDETKTIGDDYNFDETGKYTVTLGEKNRNVTVMDEEEMELKPHSLDVPEEVTVGGTGTIEATVENLQEGEEDAYIFVGDEEVHRETISGGENRTFETEHTFDEVGEVMVEVRDEEGDALLRESVSVIEPIIENAPDEPIDPRPYDGSEDVSTSPTLNVEVNHPDDAAMDVSFYQKSSNGDSLIGIDQDVPSRETASIEWNGLEENTTYSWYVVVDDGTNENTSETWSFTTSETGMNNPPDIPTLIGPKNGSTSVKTNVTLEVEVTDKDGDLLNVTFYDVENDQQIASTRSGVPTNSTVEVEWTNLSHDTTYEWKVVVEDGDNTTHSSTWSFTTVEEEDDVKNKDEEGALSIIQMVLAVALVAMIGLGSWMWYKEKYYEDEGED